MTRLPLPAMALLLVTTLALGACASSSRQRKPEVVDFDPVLVTPGPPEEQALVGLNDEELFAVGTSAYGAGDFEHSARAFARLADLYPESARRGEALYNAGLAYERLSRFAEALERFRPLMDPAKGQGDALDAAFRAAECLYHLEDYTGAIEILTVIANREDVRAQDRLQAKVQRGICLIEARDLDAAERQLREALSWWGVHKQAERLDEYFPAQAQFFLGEIYRLFFEQVELDPARGDAQLFKDLEYKCEMLLSAQGHYLRAIRIGQGQWATAGGFRIGALYEELRDAMLNARVPEGFDSEQTQLYREELRSKVRVLVTKAISIYERTLAAAERIGIDNPFVMKTRESLERMKAILLEDSGDGAATPTSAEGPAPGPLSHASSGR